MLGKWVFVLAIGACLCGCPYNCNKKPKKELCGTDGKTYRNECLLRRINCLKKKNVKKYCEGSCPNYRSKIPDPVEPQPRILYQPINCADRDPYAPCPRLLDLKCGNDLIPYANTCLMCKAGKKLLNIRHNGNCTHYELALRGVFAADRPLDSREIAPLKLPRKPDCRNVSFPCPKIYGHFVCGSDNFTYAGECQMCNERVKAMRQRKKFDVLITKVGGIC